MKYINKLFSQLEINKSSILAPFIILFLLADVRLFYLVPVPTYFTGSVANKALAGFIAILSFVFYLLLDRFKMGHYGYWVFAFLLLVITTEVFSMMSYGYSLSNILWDCFTYFALLMFFPIRDYIDEEARKEVVIIFAEILLIIMSILFLYQHSIYSGMDSVYLRLDGVISDYYLENTELPLRIFNVFDGLDRILFFVILYRILKKGIKKSLLDCVAFALVFLDILIIDRSRMYLVIVLISAVVMIILEWKNRFTISKIMAFIATTILVAVGLFAKISSMYETISGDSYSFTTRINEIKYYWDLFSDHMLLGIGIKVPDKESLLFQYFRGPLGEYYLDDIGILGVLFGFGILGFIGYLVYTLYTCYVVKHTTYNHPLSVALLVSFIMSMITLSYLDKCRVMSLLAMMIVLDYNYEKSITDG